MISPFESRRIGIFYDGNFLLHASNYYNYIHHMKRRLSLGGLHRFIQHRVAEEEGVEPLQCQIAEARAYIRITCPCATCSENARSEG